jgi:hypothetical protein
MRSPLGPVDRLRCLAVLAERADPRRFLRRRRTAIASSTD